MSVQRLSVFITNFSHIFFKFSLTKPPGLKARLLSVDGRSVPRVSVGRLVGHCLSWNVEGLGQSITFLIDVFIFLFLLQTFRYSGKQQLPG